MKVLYWGTYDTGKPRNRILIRGLRENSVQVNEIHYDLWGGVEDKSQISGTWAKTWFLLRWLVCYPRLILKFLVMPRHDVVIIGYLGHLDVLIIWLFTKIKRTTVIWDAFISLHDTVVSDRKLISRYNPLSFLIYIWEALACRAADLVILDTAAHAQFFIEHYKLTQHKVQSVFVGAEPEIFPRFEKNQDFDNNRGRNHSVLFYGQFIPLHGIETIIRAARILEQEPINWLLIGQGQEAGKIQNLLNEHPLENLTWKKWVNYSDLKAYIHQADICLGIFGDSPKASRVIPNKVYQIISSGKPVITRDSPAIRELITEVPQDAVLVPPASPEGLANALNLLRNRLNNLPTEEYSNLTYEITPGAVGRTFRSIIEKRINK